MENLPSRMSLAETMWVFCQCLECFRTSLTKISWVSRVDFV